MRKYIFIILLILCVFPAQSYSENQKIVEITAGPWPPFTGENLKNNGIATKIVRDAFSKGGIKANFYFRPWMRAFSEAKTGKYNGSILWRHTADRVKYFYYSEPIITVDIVFFHLKSKTIKWDNLSDLKKYKIGVVKGFKYEDQFDKAMQTGILNTDIIPSQEQNFKKLLKGRIDITPVVRQSGYATIDSNFSQEQAKLFTHHEKPLAKQVLHLILSKNNSENKNILESFNKGLNQLIESGNIKY